MPSRQDAPGLDSDASAPRRSKRSLAYGRLGGRHSAGQANRDADLAANNLAILVEGEILPRMMLAHGLAPDGLANNAGLLAGAQRPFKETEIDAFARMAIDDDVHELLARIDQAMDQGASLHDVFLGLLARTARRLGEMWRHDECSFVDVTIGLSKFQIIVHEFMGRAEEEPTPGANRRGALFAAPPAEEHTFGLLIVEDMFRRAGWRTASAPGAGISEIASMAQAGWYDIFGLGITCESHLDEAARLVRQVRRQSQNQGIRILAGGRIFSEQPRLAAEIGADLTAQEGDEALDLAETVVSLRL